MWDKPSWRRINLLYVGNKMMTGNLISPKACHRRNKTTTDNLLSPKRVTDKTLVVHGLVTLRDRLVYKYEYLKRWSVWGNDLYDNINRKNNIIVDSITGDVLRPLAQQVIKQNGCKHRIFLYVQYRHLWINFKGSKLSNRTPYQLILGKTQNIKLLGPIPTIIHSW